MKKTIAILQKKSFIVCIPFLLTACSNHFEASNQKVAETINDGLGCQNFKSLFMDSFYQFIETEKDKPDADQLKKSLAAVFAKSQKNIEPEKIQEFQQVLFEMIDQLVANSDQKKMSAQDLLRFFIQLEMGNQSTPLHRSQGQQLETLANRIKSLAQASDLACNQPPPPPTPVLDGEQRQALQNKLPLSLFGAHFSMATAYQSCQSIALPEMTANTEDVVGVRKGEDIGGGFKREYASVSDIVRTHYYVRQQTYSEGCFDLRKKPLVYDFGGEPNVEPHRLNFFVNSGPGGTALGLDCSAFVSSALAAAGLRYAPGLENKPIFVRQVSYDFIDPQSSGWKCFDRIQVSAEKAIEPGDIVAVKGHVVMVDRVGTDPFGLAKVQTKAGCDAVSFRNFDFSVIQSSPSKGSIGINIYSARDYLAESPKMESVFLTYAHLACAAKFDGKAYKSTSEEFGIIRHKGTESCRAPRIELANQSCIKDCSNWK